MSSFLSPFQAEAGWAAIHLCMVVWLSSDTTVRFTLDFCFLIISLNLHAMFDVLSALNFWAQFRLNPKRSGLLRESKNSCLEQFIRSSALLFPQRMERKGWWEYFRAFANVSSRKHLTSAFLHGLVGQ